MAIVGAGATGVELAAELHNAALGLAAYGLKGIQPQNMKITLIEAGPRVLPALPERISVPVHKTLEKLGVAVLTSAPVKQADADGMTLATGEVIPASLKVWAAGVKAPEFLKGLDGARLNDNELTKSIIGAIRGMDSYQLPDAKGYTSMMRYLTGRSDAVRQEIRDEILSTNGEDFIAFGEMLEKVSQSNAVAVMGSQSAIEAANLDLEVTKVL